MRYKIWVLLGIIFCFGRVEAGELERLMGLEFTELECGSGNGQDYAVELHLTETNKRYAITISTYTSSSAKTRNPTVRFAKGSITVSVETYQPEERMAGCLCAKELVFEFDKPDMNVKKVYFVQDANVLADIVVN